MLLYLFWDDIENIVSWLYLAKYQKSVKRYFSFFQILKKIALFWDQSFLPIYPKITVFREIRNHFLKSFLSISAKISTFRGELSLRWRWKHRFLPISPKIPIPGKGTFLYISLKILFCVHMSKNISISSKITLFWDHCEKFFFCQYIRKYQYFEKRSFFRSLLEIGFCVYLRKYQHYEENCKILKSRWKKVFSIFSKISKFIEKVLFFKSLWKKIVVFLYFCPKISTLRGKLHYFDITLKKSFFANISENITLFKRGLLFPLKIVFWTYLRKYQHLPENNAYIDISRKIKFFWDDIENIVFCRLWSKN